MAFAWHDHHFINRIAALDFANTVVYRNRPERREDRLRTLADFSSWFEAAKLEAPERFSLEDALGLREAIDELFRSLALHGGCSETVWREFVARYLGQCAGAGFLTLPDGLAPAPAQGLLAIAHSALSLALSPQLRQVRVCGGCAWLFVDRTRNSTKKWCISAMCGSRDKARRYYARKHVLRPAEA